MVETPGASEAGRAPAENLAVSPLAAASEVRWRTLEAPVLARASVWVAAAPGASAPKANVAGAERLGSSDGPLTTTTATSSRYQVLKVELKRKRTLALAARLGEAFRGKFWVAPAVLTAKLPRETQAPPPTLYSTVADLPAPPLLEST